ncbi:modification methylase [Mucilaginibacter achroorhodeus]|uniref:Modification methylase n=1 Tax=Mucilaginibacter achroorhodeus TaxID=2599294 RepID=A0A563U6E1_9SPHI|nr:adenine-specific methyltransferase EcoRI family protein [Mucilaginibacter achroorhodeus]TWR26893.1 modification methylase [Mucilaginibacter achroorhodeus]
MESKSSNKNLTVARNSKKDEFYTQLSDIEKELNHYKEHFRDKVVLCNCDDPRVSNFFHFFSYNFEQLGLKKLIATCYKNQNADLFSENNSERAIYLEYEGDKNGNKIPDPEEIGIKYLNGDGDFRSRECIELLKQADIVVTNPPFSLFREYVAQLIEYNKKFVIVGHQNAISYVDIFRLIKENKIWLGYGFNGGAAHFINRHYENYATAGDHKEGMIRVSGVTWFTNLEIKKRHEDLILYKSFYGNESEYPKYDYYDAINCDKTKDIPMDYKGYIGVPITYLDKYNPEQFEIVDAIGRYSLIHGATKETKGKYLTKINGEKTYARVIIRNKKL